MSWCTVWKGAPQDLMDHVRGAHKVPEEVQNIKLETLIPPWTVARKVYTESLTSRHSGISNDILLFSDIGLSLAHHYRVHKRGVPHVAFRKNDMPQLHSLLPLPAAPLTERGSPEPGCSSIEDSPDAVGASSRSSRRAFARRRITQVRETPRRVAPRLTEQGPLAAVGAMVFDCRPQVLPGAMDISGTELTEIRSMTRASVATAPPPERAQSLGGGDLLGSICPELGVAPLVDPGTDCEDDPPAVVDQEMDSELQNVFIDVVSLPTMVTPVSDIDRAFCAPEEQGLVIAPPAVSPVVIRPSTATSSAGLKLLSPIRPPASATSVGISPTPRTPPVVAVPEDFMLFNAAMTNQSQPETSPSLMGDAVSGLLPVFPQVNVPGPEMGLDASGGTPEIADHSREGPFDIHQDLPRSVTSPQLLQDT